MVLRRCRQLLGEEARAADAMQETFMNLVSHKTQLNARAPSSLLYRIATNICLNVLRKEKWTSQNATEAPLTEILNSVDPSSSWISKNLITKIFSRQKDLSAYIALLFHLDGMTLEEISSEVGLSVSGVRKRLKEVRLTAAKYRENQ